MRFPAGIGAAGRRRAAVCRKTGSAPADLPDSRQRRSEAAPECRRKWFFIGHSAPSASGTAFVMTIGMTSIGDIGQVDVNQLIERYDRPGPRYTSYPTAVEFHAGFTAADYGARLAEASAVDAPLSLYVHVPFCEARCAYCGCAVIATRKREVAAAYLDYLERELAMLAGALGRRRRVV